MAGTQLNKPHKPYGRRLAAVLLAVVLLAPAWPAAGAADQTDLPVATEKPKVTIEQRLIVDGLTLENSGFIELAVKVESPSTLPFRSIGVTIQFNTAVLSAYDWSGAEVTPAGANYSTYLPTKKSDQVSGALSLVGGKDGFLYIEAEAAEAADLSKSGGTVLAVARFGYDLATTQLAYVGDEIVQITDNTDPENPVTAPITLFEFIDEAANPNYFVPGRARQGIWHEAEDTSFYCVPAYDGTADTTEQVTETVPSDNAEHQFDAPITGGDRVRAVDRTAVPEEYYNYFSNHLGFALPVPEDNSVTFIQTRGESYDKSGSGVELSDVNVIVFYDYDDTLIGATAFAAKAALPQKYKQIDSFVAQFMENYNA